ncbi:SWIM zinc finger family protein [Pseudobacteroides cellulosolvens]|uniref:SWIM-type domain-containing protein n=1 Tax=Pseudobacteroides cellulosolvens ATCC 35603 = DSM 2933 TaxID=398512 RepID=A0A0L6JNN5_9FIRM|nr:SWIM zinc finger family protein [Pseudobacteroides cellulosolvens]KNY27441.1 hypothetical protein Bccel_2712 [Pseudobacteroides cellulosolvens ATCC 35603 = DSM 2933]
MINITEEFINQLAPNQSAVSNGWGLVKKNKFVKLNMSEDGTIIFGECSGSGSSNYNTSADFNKPESPVFRCSCPSRQFPCKHALGLMYAYVSGKNFEKAEIPEDILEKREKIDKKEQKKKEKEQEQPEPKKVNVSALKKKVKTQIEGLEVLEKLVYSIVQNGLGTINKKTIALLEDQAKQLGNYYLSGPQAALREFIYLFKENENHEKIYTDASDLLSRLYALCKKGREHLSKKLQSDELAPDNTSSIEDSLGYTWQLNELKNQGLLRSDTELIQLAFTSFPSASRGEYVDNGIWFNFTSGEVHNSYNFRPFKAVKYIREDDSISKVLMIKELYTYPGTDLNCRVRWENNDMRDADSKDFLRIRSFAKESFSEAVKLVKNQIKNPLSDKAPVILLKFLRFGTVDNEFVIEDHTGQRLILEKPQNEHFPEGINILKLLKPEMLADQVMLLRFWHDMDRRRLTAVPLSLITNNRIIRLGF